MKAVKEDVEGMLVIGMRDKKEGIKYKIADETSPGTSLSVWKWYQQNNRGGDGDILYVGKVKSQETEKGLILTLEDIDMSQVKINEYELPPYIREAIEKRRKLEENALEAATRLTS